MANPYLNIDPKFFNINTSDNLILTKADLKRFPELFDIINLDKINKNGEYNFTNDPYEIQKKIAVTFLKSLDLLIVIKDVELLNITEIYNLNPADVKLKYIYDHIPDNIRYKDNPNFIDLNRLTQEDQLYLFKVFFSKTKNFSESTETYTVYLNTLTDIYMESNKFKVITDMKNFIIETFGIWLKCSEGTIPFSCDFKCSIKDFIQVKNLVTFREIMKTELELFFNDLKLIYKTSILLTDFHVLNKEGFTGSDTITIYIKLKIQDQSVNIVLNIKT